jgi:hypothetical protein
LRVTTIFPLTGMSNRIATLAIKCHRGWQAESCGLSWIEAYLPYLPYFLEK